MIKKKKKGMEKKKGRGKTVDTLTVCVLVADVFDR